MIIIIIVIIIVIIIIMIIITIKLYIISFYYQYVQSWSSWSSSPQLSSKVELLKALDDLGSGSVTWFQRKNDEKNAGRNKNYQLGCPPFQ